MNGRRVFHARGKVLGGSSSINGMIFQRGNPMDYERWGAEPGMKEWDYLHCLPYFKRMENCLAGADDWRGGDGPLKLERGPADQPALRRVLRGRAGGRLPADRRRQRLPAGGLREVRPQRLPRPPALRRPRLPAPGQEPEEPHRRDDGVRHQGALPGQARGRRRLPARRPAAPHRRRGRGHPLRRRDQQPAAAPALRRRRPRSCCGCTTSTWSTTCPASARTSRTTSRSTSSTPPSSRSRSRPACAGGPGPGSPTSGCSTAAGSAPPTTSRAAASRAATRTSTTRT